MQPETFDSQDLGQVEAFVSKIYSTMRIGAVGEHTRVRISRRVLTPEVGFDDLSYTFDIEYSAQPPDLLIICDVIPPHHPRRQRRLRPTRSGPVTSS